ncbi:uncharacterized protein LOC112450231 [Kryptolebias marmoratus]|uniref:uncharacterized protein LOC112450231 n=1 Tax=Kryptolebias marmoratus TaxID=37003 RepID=UPI000D52FAF2|nr:uncharacterized protein LOC112450231 [Kryptolebias marmoratus]
MDKQQAALEETLMGDRRLYTMAAGHLVAPHQPRGPRDFFKWAAALIVVISLLLVASVTGLIACYFFFKPSAIEPSAIEPSAITPLAIAPLSSNQEALHERNSTKVVKTSKLDGIARPEGHHIFTVEKGATYLIYGWVKFQNKMDELPELIQKINDQERTFSSRTIKETEIFFFEKVLLANNSTIRLSPFKSKYTDSCFHMYEL